MTWHGRTVSLVCFVTWPALAAAQMPSVSDIRDAWAARQARVQSFCFAWHSVVTHPTIPDEAGATVHRQQRTLVVDGMNVRDTRQGLTLVDGKYVNMPYTSIFKDDVNIVHFDDGIGMDAPFGKSLGNMFAAEHVEQHNYHVEPMMLHFRVLPEKLSALDCRRMHIADHPDFVDDRKCFVVTIPDRDQLSSWVLWTDPQRGFAIVRYSVHLSFAPKSGAPLMRECDINYSHDEASGEWVPREWHTQVFHGGKLFERVTSKVRSAAINQDVDASEFVYQFPVGTRVTRQKEDGGQEEYTVHGNGKQRPIH